MRVSHRYDRLPLLHSWPGGVQQELVVPAGQRYTIFNFRQILNASTRRNLMAFTVSAFEH